jgi:hypothetical protein
MKWMVRVREATNVQSVDFKTQAKFHFVILF